MPAGCRSRVPVPGCRSVPVVKLWLTVPAPRESCQVPTLSRPLTEGAGGAAQSGATTKLRFRFTFKQQLGRGEAGCAGEERAAGVKRPGCSLESRARPPPRSSSSSIGARQQQQQGQPWGLVAELGSLESWTLEVGHLHPGLLCDIVKVSCQHCSG